MRLLDPVLTTSTRTRPLIPTLTARENITYFGELHGLSRADRAARASELIEMLEERGAEAIASLAPGEQTSLTVALLFAPPKAGTFTTGTALAPGNDLQVVEIGPDGTRTLEVKGSRVSLGQQLGDNLWVLPA